VRIIRCRRGPSSPSHHTFDVPPVRNCRRERFSFHFAAQTLYNDAHPTASSHIPHPNGTGTGYCRVQDRDHQGVDCVMCADVPLRPWHFGRNTVRDRHSVSLSHLDFSAPTRGSLVWYSSTFGFKRSSSMCVYCRTVGFCTVHEVSDNNVSHSHRGSVAVTPVTHTRVRMSVCMAIWFHQPRRVDAQPQLLSGHSISQPSLVKWTWSTKRRCI